MSQKYSKFLNEIEEAIGRRYQQIPECCNGEQSCRWVHKECPPLRIDKVGEVIVLGWWDQGAPSGELLRQLAILFAKKGYTKWYLQHRSQQLHGTEVPTFLESESIVPPFWKFKEGTTQYFARKSCGNSFGLFLDQRDHRQWLKESSQGKSILNLFSFTCGFSVAAALGGAKEVVSVDLSRVYLDWGRENFQLNGLDPESFGFVKMDGIAYLKWLKKKGRKFDIVICDPPSFSRGPQGTFKVERDYSLLIKNCLDVLTQDGLLHFSTNFEKWSLKHWKSRLNEAGFRFKNLPNQLDFEGEFNEANLKAFRFRRSAN